LTKKDAKEIASIHSLAFPNFFLTALGEQVLKVFYASLIDDKGTIASAVKENNSIVGFFVASTEPNGLYARIFKKNISIFFFPLTLAFLKRPSLLKRMIVSLTSTKSYNIPDNTMPALLSICVKPDSAGNGVGKVLIGELERALIAQSKNGYYLTTDAENNIATNQFYLKNGFHLHTAFFQGKRSMNLYTKYFS
jgi:GNAT superfamily N-acetyltransferase